MKISDCNSILKKHNLQLTIFVDVRPRYRAFFKIEDLIAHITKQLEQWEALTESLPNCGLIIQSLKTVMTLLETAISDEQGNAETIKGLISDIARETYARPLVTFEKNPLPGLLTRNATPKDWIGIVVQKIAVPDQVNIFNYDSRISEMYFVVVAQISADGIEKIVELDRSLEWNREFRDRLLGFIEEQDKQFRSLEAERQQVFEANSSEHTKRIEQMRTTHEEIFKNIEKTYEEEVRIAKPAELWEKKQTDYQAQGRNWLWASIGIALAICTVGFLFFLFFPEVIKNSSTGTVDFTGSLKWLLLVGVGIGSLVFLLRQTVRLSISGFHMSRDAEEKSALTSFYLSLIANKSLDPEKEIEIRTIIMNSLFARVDTGLLKGDNAPTMPGGGISDIAKLVSGKT